MALEANNFSDSTPPGLTDLNHETMIVTIVHKCRGYESKVRASRCFVMKCHDYGAFLDGDLQEPAQHIAEK